MSVYVDALIPTIPSRFWPFPEACHMLADTADELHAMASRIGLRREWAQARPVLHYDLTAARRAKAVRAGAVESSRRKIVEVMRSQRAAAR